ncbi:MAG TPA: alpha/beta fold hydrolase [Deltaproteobacteria bacterium]|nr:alpha/beta fold hydrolase [Deltaproteobacteria bacterium]
MAQREDKYLKIEGITTRYWSVGEQGDALILIHGFGTSMEIWRHNIDELAKKFRVFAFDVPGFGFSDKTPINDFISFMPKFINGFMEALNIEKAHFMGVSLGGALSIKVALEYPQKVAKLIPVDSGGFGTYTPFTNRIATLPVLGELLTRPNRNGTRQFLESLVYDPKVLGDETIDFYYKLSAMPGASQACLRLLRALFCLSGIRKEAVYPMMSRLGEIKSPTLIIWGRHDKSFPVDHAYYGHERIKNSLVYIVEESGHLPNFEKPEEFNRIVLDFLYKE